MGNNSGRKGICSDTKKGIKQYGSVQAFAMETWVSNPSRIVGLEFGNLGI
jgi:hypothetical protein